VGAFAHRRVLTLDLRMRRGHYTRQMRSPCRMMPAMQNATITTKPDAPLPGMKLFNLKGRTALITGGSKGLGYAMAAGLASAGADVMLVSRHVDEAKASAAEIARDFGVRAVGHATDVTVAAQVDEMITAAERLLGKVDILINSAGINIRGPIAELTLAQYEQVMSEASPGNRAPSGLISHVGGPTDNGWCVVEVWESQQAQADFMGSRLGAAMAAAGITAVPQMTWARVMGHRNPGL